LLVLLSAAAAPRWHGGQASCIEGFQKEKSWGMDVSKTPSSRQGCGPACDVASEGRPPNPQKNPSWLMDDRHGMMGDDDDEGTRMDLFRTLNELGNPDRSPLDLDCALQRLSHCFGAELGGHDQNPENAISTSD
jgi:hypothetical protein